MKKIFLFTLIITMFSCKAQIYPLRTFTDIPINSYEKDTNNELPLYEGTWKGTWDNKTIFITFKKMTNQYDAIFQYYRDYLIGKFKVLDSNGNVQFDNTNISDNDPKILGSGYRKIDDKYSLIYIDPDLCLTSGNIIINFTDSSKTKLNWKYNERSNMITTDCPYYNTVPFPQALPQEIVLTKQ